MNFYKITFSSLILFATLQTFASETKRFGAGANMDKLVAISTVLDTPEDFLDKELTITGKIVSVCQKAGCWMKLQSDIQHQSMRVKVKDGDMIFPPNARGEIAYATGKLSVMNLSKEKTIAYLSHLAEDAGEKFDPTTVSKGMTLYQLVPTGVTIEYATTPG